MILTNCQTHKNISVENKKIPINKKYIFINLINNDEVLKNIKERIKLTKNINYYFLTNNINEANIIINIDIKKIYYSFSKSSYITSNYPKNNSPETLDKNKLENLEIRVERATKIYFILGTNLEINCNDKIKNKIYDESKIKIFESKDDSQVNDFFDALFLIDDLIKNEEMKRDGHKIKNLLYSDSAVINRQIYSRYKREIEDSLYNSVMKSIEATISGKE